MDPDYPCFVLAEALTENGLTGRNCGASLRNGLTFNRLRRVRYFGEVHDFESEDLYEPKEIVLKVERIEAYQTTLTQLSPGMAALLEVSGESLRLVRKELDGLGHREQLSVEYHG